MPVTAFDKLVAYLAEGFNEQAIMSHCGAVGLTIHLGNLTAFAKFVPSGLPRTWMISGANATPGSKDLRHVMDVPCDDPARVLETMQEVAAIGEILKADPRPVARAAPSKPVSMLTTNPQSSPLNLGFLCLD